MSRLIDADILDNEVMHLFIAITGNPKQHTVVNECKSSFRNMIEKQPTVEAETQWIPCSERLPVENGWYLVTNILGVVQQQYWGARKWQKLREEFVIAWQPLPQPYKAEQTLAKMEGGV